MLQMQPLKKLLKYVAIIPELLFKKENKKIKGGEEGRHNDILIIHLSLPVTCARLSFPVCWNEPRAPPLMAVELLLDLCLYSL